MCSPWNQRRSGGGSSTALGYSAFASWNNLATENGGPYVLAPHVRSISTSSFYTGIGNAYASHMRDGITVPPQPAFSVSQSVQ